MTDPVNSSRRVVIYAVTALGLGYATFLIMLGFEESQCGDLESDCDLAAIGSFLGAVLVVAAVMPVVVVFGEIWARARKRG